jgi:hypothetical protein
MYYASYWLQPRNENQNQTAVTARKLEGIGGHIVSECQLTIEESSSNRIGQLVLLMTNDQARQLVTALTLHLEANANS